MNKCLNSTRDKKITNKLWNVKFLVIRIVVFALGYQWENPINTDFSNT